MEPSLPALKAFVAVAESQHFARAARDLHITPPALSQQITRLERQVGVRLFDRSSRNVELTPAGVRMLPLAREVIQANARLASWTRRLDTALVRIGFSNIGPADFTDAMFTAIKTQHPDVALEFRYAHRDEVAEGLMSGGLDVGFFWGPVAVAGLESHTLLTEPRVLVLSESTAQALGESPLDIDHLAELRMIAPRSADRLYISWSVEDPRPDGSRARVGATADGLEETLALVAAADLIALFPKSVADGFRHRGVVKRRVDGLSRSPYSIAFAARGAPAATHDFVDVVLSVAADWDESGK